MGGANAPVTHRRSDKTEGKKIWYYKNDMAINKAEKLDKQSSQTDVWP